jgi:hypothetical protein
MNPSNVSSAREPYTPPPRANGHAQGETAAAPTLDQRLRERMVRIDSSWIKDKPPPLEYLSSAT